MNRLIYLILTMSLFGCASLPTIDSPPTIVILPTDSVSSPVVDMIGLRRSLHLERTKQELGYLDRSFATCSAGYGYSASRDCESLFFVSIHFQILCRDSEGTISTALGSADLKPLSGRLLYWTLGDSKGSMVLDGEGYGQIQIIFRKTQHHQRLKLSVDNDFVYIRAGEVKRIVTPRNWCN